MSKIKIGVTLDYCNDNQYAKYPYYALRENYIECLANSGIVEVVPLHYSASGFEELAGIMVTGGNFDIDPKFYNEVVNTDTIVLNEKRTNFEYDITEYAMKRRIPFFGICGGMQLLNVVHKGSLIQDIIACSKGNDHSQKTPKHLPSHRIVILENTRLFEISGQKFQDVNSTHHQAIEKPGENLIVSAIADDGIIEAIELDDPTHFALGVQWHPEYMTTEFDKNLISGFIQACQKK